MKKLYILPLIAAALITTGCSKEDPFGPGNEGEGQFLKSSISVDVQADGLEHRNAPTRAAADPDVDDFTVIFTREGNSQPFAKYRYGDMPEVVTLPAGTYTCTATYGENRSAEWESPYFLGTSETFEVVPYEIVSYLKPIECKLENIKVTVDFDAELRASMSADSYAEVKVGSSAALNYGIAEADSQKAGYFMHAEEISLVAVFHGTIEGSEVVETKSLKNIQKGNHYKITFKMHPGSGSGATGDVDGDVVVDASVSVTDVERNIEIGEEILEEEGDRPTEGGEDPQPPTPGGDAPTIVGANGLDLDKVHDGSSLESCILNINSTADDGIQELYCDIESPTLTPEELENVGLSSHLNLAETGDLTGPLGGLGLPVNVKGQKSVEFNITGFLVMLGSFTGEHHFIVTVKDANGSASKTLKIKF